MKVNRAAGRAAGGVVVGICYQFCPRTMTGLFTAAVVAVAEHLSNRPATQRALHSRPLTRIAFMHTTAVC